MRIGSFDTLDLALWVAIRGHGVALGDLNLVRESPNDGVLIAPFDIELNQSVLYFLIYPSQRAPSHNRSHLGLRASTMRS